LVKSFIEKFNSLHGRAGTENEIQAIRDDAMDALRSHRWPGNVRELENVVERAFVLENSRFITMGALPEELKPVWMRPLDSNPAPGAHADDIDFHDQKDRFEKEFILQALRRNAGRINQTVANAGIPKNTLLRKMRKYGISAADLDAEEQLQDTYE
jgi:two-component system response regulator AtoC